MDTLEALKASNGIDETSLIDGLWQVHAIARFDTAGALVTANTAFQTLLGLDRAALRGATHHDVCSGHLRRGDEHALFWASLMAGTPRQCELTLRTTAIRVQGAHPATGAREPEAAEVWVRASYIPARDSAGIVTGVVMFATDITAEKQAAAKAATLAAAMNRSYAIVEFDLSGQILGANDNFLHLMGYRSSEIVGRHHSIFCEESYAQSDAYQRFWSQLSAGRHEVGEFMRIGAGGREVWIQATYNPVFDTSGRPVGIIKCASDVTAMKGHHAKSRAQQVAMADGGRGALEFDLEGYILRVDEHFLATTEFAVHEVVGHHHSMLCTLDYLICDDYRTLWSKLRRGEPVSCRYPLAAKYQRTLHVDACYTPITDLRGNVIRILSDFQVVARA